MDYRLEHWINGPAGNHPFWDALMRDAATWAVPLFAGIVAVWFAYGLIFRLSDERRGAVTALLAAGGGLLVNQIVLLIWSRERPFQAHPGAVHTLVSPSTDGSFPSDHAVAATAIAVALLMAHRRLGLVALAGAALVCVARVYVGAHYPGDVVAAAAIGAAVAILASRPLAFIPGWASAMVDRLLALLRVPVREGGAGI